jgi:hypothetical protein
VNERVIIRNISGRKSLRLEAFLIKIIMKFAQEY